MHLGQGSISLIFSSIAKSVANAVFHPPNWATLKSLASGQKNFQIYQFPVKLESFFEPFQWPKTFFSSIYQYLLSTSCGRQHLIVFPPNWVILIILWLKSTKIWESGRMIT